MIRSGLILINNTQMKIPNNSSLAPEEEISQYFFLKCENLEASSFALWHLRALPFLYAARNLNSEEIIHAAHNLVNRGMFI
jgi:hypothetical protein